MEINISETWRLCSRTGSFREKFSFPVKTYTNNCKKKLYLIDRKLFLQEKGIYLFKYFIRKSSSYLKLIWPNGKCRLLLMNNPGQDLNIFLEYQKMKTSTTFSDHVRTTTFSTSTDAKRPLTIYHTAIPPDKIIIVIVTAIFVFPIVAFLCICLLRKRAKKARERDRQLNFGLQSHAVSLVRFSHFPGESDFLIIQTRMFYRSGL